MAYTHGLLRAVEGATNDEIAQALYLGTLAVHRTCQRSIDAGLLLALSERLRPDQRPALTGKPAAFSVALACSTPPAGHRRWILCLLADRLTELQQIEAISHDTVGCVLKKRPQTMAAQRRGHSERQSP